MRATELDDWSDDDLDSVGARVERTDALDKATGRARYTSDVRLSGQLTGVIVRSPIVHGRVVSIDASAARGIDGVVAVITADDVAEYSWYDDEVPLLPGTVRFVGDDVGRRRGGDGRCRPARGGARRCRVRTIRPPDDPDRVGDDDVPTLLGNDDIEVDEDGRGNVEDAWATAATIVEGTLRTPVAIHNSLEPHGAVADWRGTGRPCVARSRC